MRIALCLSGELRSIDSTIDKLVSVLCNPKWEIDVYYAGWEDDPNIDKLKYLDRLGKIQVSMVQPRINVDTSYWFPDKTKENIHLSIVRQLYCIAEVNNLCEKSNISYDFVVRCRPDILFTSETTLNFSLLCKDKLYVLDHDNWHGLNDRFYIGSPSIIHNIDNRLSKLKYYNEVGGVSQYEAFLLFVAETNGVEIERLIGFDTCLLRENGDREGELIHIKNGILTRRPDGIWHNQFFCYI